MGGSFLAIQRIVRISAVDQICDSIKRLMVDGTLKPSDKLSSESELAEQFGVNRFTVRLALQKLSTLGLIETRVGEGSFVCDISIRNYVQEMQIFWENDLRYSDIRRLRYLIETDSLTLAAENATEEEKAELKEKLDHFEALLKSIDSSTDDETLEKLVSADLDFHFQVVHMSHNLLYAEVYTIVQELVKSHIQYHIERTRESCINGRRSEDFMHKCAYNAVVYSDKKAAEKYGKYMINEIGSEADLFG